MKKLILLGIVSFGLMLTGCGGGGSADTASGSSVEPTSTITKKNAEPVTKSSFYTVGGISEMDFQSVVYGLRSVSTQRSSVLDELQREFGIIYSFIDKHDLRRSIEKREKGTVECDRGGSYSYDTTEESGGSVVFHSCKFSLDDNNIYTAEGKVDFAISNDLLDSITFDGYKVSVEGYGTTYIQKAKVEYKDYDEYGNPGEIDIMNMSGYMKILPYNDYANIPEGTYRFSDLTYKTIGLNSTVVKFDADGMISAPQTDGWVKISMPVSITMEDNNDCPVAGDLDVEGAEGKTKLKFNADGSAELYFDGDLLKSYDTCGGILE